MFKKIFVLSVLVLMFCGIQSSAQTTIILLRHAEKAVATGDMSATDPELSEAGKKRAQSLLSVLKEYKPDAIYSTNYIRTKTTVAPLAEKFGKTVEVYDPRKMNEFAEELKKMNGKTIVVAGHSNTTPALVNLLMGENKYQPLDDSVYGKLWVVTIDKDGKTIDKIVEY